MKRFIISAFADEASELLYEQIDAMRENGVDMLEIRGVNGRNIAEMTRGEVKAARHDLDASGIGVWSIGSPIGKIKITDDFDKHIEIFKKTLDYANILDAKCFRLFSFYDVNSEERENEAIERLAKLCEIAKGSDVTLCHENEKGIFGDKAAPCLKILKALPDLRAVFDPANFIQVGQDTLEAWEMLAPYVKYMHIKDGLANGSIVPAGKGIGNVPEIVAMYEKLDVTPKALSVEPHLKVFSGLAGLEGGKGENEKIDKLYEYGYSSNREAFSAAVSALKDVINNI